jgi:5-methylcytosine-specific restriction endonuclease McrA
MGVRWNREHPERRGELARQWQGNNPDKVREYKKRWEEKHKDEERERRRTWRKENPDKARESNRKYKEKNKDKIKNSRREYQIKYPERARLSCAKYRLNNPDRVKEHRLKWDRKNREKRRINSHNWRARKKSNGGSFTLAEWEILKKQYGNRCPACRRIEPNIKLTMDHVIPLSRGGSNNIENIQPLCMRCNDTKHRKIWRIGPNGQISLF